MVGSTSMISLKLYLVKIMRLGLQNVIEWRLKGLISVTNSDWSMFDDYVPQAMADRGFYTYEILNKERIENNLYGMAVYKVKVLESGSHSTKYLMVYINADGSYWKSSF